MTDELTIEEEIRLWYDIKHKQELEEEEDLQIWFEIMMEREREQDEALRQDMYEYMDSVFESECRETDNELTRPHFTGTNNGSDVVKRRRTGSRIKRQQQMLSRKLHACNRQVYDLK